MAANPINITPAQRYTIISPAGTPVTRDCLPSSDVTRTLAPGTIVVCAEVQEQGNDRQRVRISSPAGWVDAESLGPAAPLGPRRPDYAFFMENQARVAPGDFHGLEFPFTVDALGAKGPGFLTAAFHASGYLSKDNSVVEIVELAPLGLFGASDSALLTVAYAKADPTVATKLFVKFPPADPDYKYYHTENMVSEMQFALFSQRGTLPVEVPRCCYNDFSGKNWNFILITERIPFGVASVEPACRKGYDFKVPAVVEHYEVLAESLAKLVAAHKTGVLGDDVEQLFPFAASARNFEHISDAEARVDRLIDFTGRVASQLFIPEATNPAFIRRFREDVLFGLEHKDDVVAYLNGNVDYVGLCHYNLNIDNAWFWRDPSGALQAGLFDWAGAGQMSIAQALGGMLMMLDPSMHLPIVDKVISTFIKTYSELSGIQLDRSELKLQYKAALFSTTIEMILTKIIDVLPRFSNEDYGSMHSRYDNRLLETQMCSCIKWIDNLLREWRDEMTPGDACRIILARSSFAHSTK